MNNAVAKLLGSTVTNLFGWIFVLPIARTLRVHFIAEYWIRSRIRATREDGFWMTCLGDYYATARIWDRAEANYRSAIALMPGDGFPHAIFAGYLVTRGHREDAIRQYKLALEKGIKHGEDFDRAIREKLLDLENSSA